MKIKVHSRAVRSKISSRLIVASCVKYSDCGYLCCSKCSTVVDAARPEKTRG